MTAYRIKTLLLLSLIIGSTIFILTKEPDTIWFYQGKLKFINQQLTIPVDIAKTRLQQEKGLMFKEELSNNRGLLLIYKQEKKIHIWMKNMLIPLDIIYISADKHIISFLKNIPPCIKAPCVTHKSNIPSKSVLEVKAGFIDRYKINIGDKVDLIFN